MGAQAMDGAGTTVQQRRKPPAAKHVPRGCSKKSG